MGKTVEGATVQKLKLKMWKILLIVAILVTIILVAFIALVVYATNIKVETWWMTKKYEEGFSFILQLTPPEFSVTIEIAIGNPSAFAVIVSDIKAKLILNEINMGSLSFEEEWYVIPPFGWQAFTGTYSVTGDNADTLESADTYNIYLTLRGKATCMFYGTLFETTHSMYGIRL